MKNVLIFLALITAFAFAVDSYPVEGPGGGGAGTDDLLQYDDGTGNWIMYNVSYFGVWFDVTDFLPGSLGFECNYTEWWHYHHSQVPWETDDAILEVWDGDVAGPTTIVATNTVGCAHLLPEIVTYSTPLTLGTDFWLFQNASGTTNGTPTAFYDEFDNFTGISHTFLSDDGILWDPLEVAGQKINVLFRAEGSLITSLDSESWGAIKGLFR